MGEGLDVKIHPAENRACAFCDNAVMYGNKQWFRLHETPRELKRSAMAQCFIVLLIQTGQFGIAKSLLLDSPTLDLNCPKLRQFTDRGLIHIQ